jgi:RNA polymerase sigma-70 factor (ECF subfamily)
MITDQESDRDIVERVLAGDKQSFNLLVTKYQNRLFRLVLHIVQQQAEAEDVLQETFLKAYRALPYFRGDAAFYTWLYRIALNTAKHSAVYRSRRRETFQTDEEIDAFTATLPDHGPDSPEAIMASGQVATLLSDAMDKLLPAQRTAIVLREIEGMTYAQISNVMKTPIGTVRSRIFRAREILYCKLSRILAQPGALFK